MQQKYFYNPFSVKVEFKRNNDYFLFTAIIYYIGNIAQFTLHIIRMNTEIDKGIIILQGSFFFT